MAEKKTKKPNERIYSNGILLNRKAVFTFWNETIRK